MSATLGPVVGVVSDIVQVETTDGDGSGGGRHSPARATRGGGARQLPARRAMRVDSVVALRVVSGGSSSVFSRRSCAPLRGGTPNRFQREALRLKKDLSAYFDRIGYGDVPAVDLETLSSLVARHVNSISFENLDVQLGRIPAMSVDAVYAKIVNEGRGGWCYEMNGLFGWTLAEVGFDVTRVAGGVMREAHGDGQLGNHLALLVKLDRTYLVDVGFGGSLTRPIALEPGAHDCSPYGVALDEVGDGFWRFSEKAHREPFSYDFRAHPADESLLAEKCRWQATHATSSFVLNVVAQRRRGDRHFALRGKVLTETRADGEFRTLVRSQAEWVEILDRVFELEVPDAGGLWSKVSARHAELFGSQEDPGGSAC
jgi:arylamine N-acetyltransferase